MNNNNPLAKREPLEVTLADCDRIEDEFTRKAVAFSNFFTDSTLKGEAAKQVISRLDHLNRIKLVYDPGQKEPAKKPSKVKRAIITAITTTALMGAAYFGAWAYFGRQNDEAQIQGLRAENRFVLLQKQKTEKNNLEQQKYISELRGDYAESLGEISALQSAYGQDLAETKGRHFDTQRELNQTREQLGQKEQEYSQLELANSRLRKNNSTLVSRITGLRQEQESVKAEFETYRRQTKGELGRKEQAYSLLEQVASGLKKENSGLQKSNSALVGRISELTQEQGKTSSELARLQGYSLEIERFIEEQIIQRTKKYGEYRHQGPFSQFVDGYAEFFFGRPANEQQKQIISNVFRKYVKTDGKNIDDVLQSWKCSTIILQYKDRLQIIDP